MSDSEFDTRPDPFDDPMHGDKFNDPRAAITPRGIKIGLVVAVLGILGAAASIYARRTRLEKTTEFWGPTVIETFQLAEKMELRRLDGSLDPVDLTGVPGLGHLRRTLLDERHYAWDEVQPRFASEFCPKSIAGDPDDKDPRCVSLTFTDPSLERFDPLEVIIDLDEGWIGQAGEERRARINDHVRPRLKRWFATTINYEPLRYDLRD